MKYSESILELEKALEKLENLHASFDYIRIGIASPKRIKSWAERTLPNGEKVGEVLKAETINFRTHQPENAGLFCERIFGPTKNWKCKCGKYNGFIIDKICEECWVEVIEARVRRYRMGYIDLTCPVAHIWYLKGIPNYLCLLLRCFDENLSTSDLEKIIYFKEGARIIEKANPLYSFFLKSEEISHNAYELKKYKISNFTPNQVRKISKYSYTNDEEKSIRINFSPEKRRGSEIIKAALESIRLSDQIKISRSLINKMILGNAEGFFSNDNKSIVRRIRILESFLSTKTNPSWMVLTTLPVLPPNLRPLLELESGRLVAADINEVYRLIITRNQRLFDFLYNFIAPDLISIHGRKLLQEGVDSLIDNGRLSKQKIFSLNNKGLKSLTENLEGKSGRFRQSLLGKRVDYSGRSVIVVGPQLRINECGLPYDMARELFQPFLINQLLKTKITPPSHNTKLANVIIKKNKPFIWTLLKNLILEHSILLNRAPTLHRFGIQAFDPVIILGQAIHLHPLVCTGFNADFDGDQMAVHLPLYQSSQLEAKTMMRPSYNLLSPSNGEVILKPTQDMVIGCYYLTFMISRNNFCFQKIFSNEKEALIAFHQKKLSIHTSILIRYLVENSDFRIQKNKLIFSRKIKNHVFSFFDKEVFIHKIFALGKENLKYFFITNLGIILAYRFNVDQYKLTEIFLETSPGRLLFSHNFQNSLN